MLLKLKINLQYIDYGIILNCLYIFFLLAIGENAKSLYIPLGIVYGLSQGVYWVACHNIINELNSDSDCKKYVSSREVFLNILKIVLPIVIGTSIHFSSFTNVGIVIFFITLIQIVLSFCIKQPSLNANNAKSFNLLGYFSHLKKLGEKASNLYHYYHIEFYSALVKESMSTLIIIMIMMTFGSTLDLGILTTLFSICTIIAIYFLGHFYRKEKCRRYILISLVFMLLSTLILAFNISKMSVIFYRFCNSIFLVVMSTLALFQRYDTVTGAGLTDYISEHQVSNELALAFGRIVTYGSLFLASFLDASRVFPILLIFFAMFLIPYAKHILAIEKK